MSGEPEVFIAYAADTKALAEELAGALEAKGMRAWADFRLQPGDRWRDELDSALERAKWLLVVVSPASRVSHLQDQEWRAVLQAAWEDPGKVLIPVMVGADDAPPFFSEWVPLRVDPGANGSRWTDGVLRALDISRVSRRPVSERERATRRQQSDQVERTIRELRNRELELESEPVS